MSHRNAPYKLFAKRILKLRHPKHLFFMYCSRSPLLHYFYRTQVRSLPCPETKSLTPCSSWYWFQIRFVKIDLWTYLSYIDLSIYLITLLHGYVKVVLCISRPLPNKTKLDQDFKVCWSFCFERYWLRQRTQCLGSVWKCLKGNFCDSIASILFQL